MVDVGCERIARGWNRVVCRENLNCWAVTGWDAVSCEMMVDSDFVNCDFVSWETVAGRDLGHACLVRPREKIQRRTIPS